MRHRRWMTILRYVIAVLVTFLVLVYMAPYAS